MPAGSEIFQGVFGSFFEASANESGHTESRWMAKSLEELRKAKGRSGGATVRDNYLVNSIITGAAAFRPKGTRMSVLDVGGNLGQLYFDLRNQGFASNLAVSVLERRDFLDAFRSELPAEINFHHHIDSLEREGQIDIVHFGSVIQYFEDYKIELAELVEAAGAPLALVFSDAYVGSVPTFFSNQKYFDSSMSVCFINRDEFVSLLSSLGYEVVLESNFRIDGKNYFPATSLPKSHQISTTKNFVFSRI